MKRQSKNGDSRELKPIIPQGVQVYFGEEVDRRRRVEAVLAGIMRCWGFREIILPFFDYLEDFHYGLGSHLGERVYRFLDRDGSLLALRPDLTTLVAKTVATRMTRESLPIKLFYSGEVFRQERSGAGRQKEFYQIGLESMGEGSVWSDLEVILIAIDSLLHLGVEDFTIALGHVGLFNGIVSGLGLSAEKADALRCAIDHKDAAWLRREIEPLALSPAKRTFLEELPEMAGGREVLDRALGEIENSESREALAELVEIDAVLTTLGLRRYLTFDLAEVRGLDYYTGIVFKIYGRSLFEMGGGGRYDGLLGHFGRDLPAVGFSFTLDRLLPLVSAIAGTFAAEGASAQAAVTVGEGPIVEAFRRAWDARREGSGVRSGRSG